MRRYWLRIRGLQWQEVNRCKFIEAERAAGFYPKSADGLATAGFGNNLVEGRVTYGKITKKNYGWDTEFLRAAKKYHKPRKK